MQYPHWLIVAGAVLVVVGFIGFALHKNNAEQVENNLKQEAPPPEEPAERRDLLTKGLTEFREERIDLPKAKEKELPDDTLISDVEFPTRIRNVLAVAGCPPWQLESAMQKATTFEHGGKVYEVRAIPTLNGWKVRIFVEGNPANGFTYSVDSEVYQDAAIDGVPEDLVAGLMETAERDFRRGVAQELVAAEKATDDDIAAEIDKFKP
jgi:hypothetical protein